MNKRMLSRLVLVALLGTTAFATCLHFLEKGRPRIGEAQIGMIQVGMSLEQVEKILGCKAGNYAYSMLLPIDMTHYSEEQQNNPAPYREWAADTSEEPYENANGPNRRSALAVRVWFDHSGRVIDKCRMGYEYKQPTWAARIKAILASRR